MQNYTFKNDIPIFDNIKSNCDIPETIIDIVMDYIGICMYCQQDVYPMYIKKIYGYRICIDCIWTSFAGSFLLKYQKIKSERKIKKYKCVCGVMLLDNNRSIYRHLKYQCDNIDLERELRCWCGEIFIITEKNVDDIKDIVKKHEEEIIHIRRKDIKKIMESIDGDKKRKIELMKNCIPVFLNFFEKEKPKDGEVKTACFLKFLNYVRNDIDNYGEMCSLIGKSIK